MANWCETEYTFVGDRAELEAAYKLLWDLQNTDSPKVESDFGATFLGNLLYALGEDYTKIPCRGLWRGLDLKDDSMNLITCTAHCQLNEVWDLFCRRFPSLTYFYYAEEVGCEIFQTNDAEGLYYPWRYVVNYFDNDERHYYKRCVSPKETIDFVNHSSGQQYQSLEQIVNELPYCYINEVEVVTKESDLKLQAITKAILNHQITFELK